MKPFAGPEDLAAFDPERDLSFPGEFPFTRGIQPTMYRGRLWTMRQYAGFGTASESNQRYRYLLSQGVSGLSVAFDLPTQIGYDSDHNLASGEVGRVGVAIDSIEDMAALFDGIPLDKVSTSMTINATAIILLALYVAVGKRQGVAPKAAVGNDSERHPQGIHRARHLHLSAAGVAADRHRHLRVLRARRCRSGTRFRSAGITSAKRDRRRCRKWRSRSPTRSPMWRRRAAPGLDVNSFGQRLSFFFNAHNDFLEEVAKFRAARRLWARIMKDRFGATNPRAQQLRFHTQTAGSTLTAQQPDNNIVRVAVQAMAAVMGGTQSLHTNGRDEALALPTEDAARIALRTQQIIGFESGVANTIDPFAGSYHIEKLTSEIEDGARELLTRIEAAGGTLAAIEAGYIQRQVQESAYKAQLAIDSGEAVVVGVNKYATDDPSTIEVFQVDPQLEVQQVQRVQAVRAGARCTERGRPRSTPCEVRPRHPTTSSRRSSPRSKRRPRSAKLPIHSASVFGEYREVSLD